MVDLIFDANLLVALPVAFLAGLISFASPCVLPLVPGYLSYAAGTSNRRILGSILFVLGFSTLFVLYGAAFGGIGAKVLANEELLTRILGGFTILMGLIFMGRIPFVPTFKLKATTNAGLLSAPILGFLFGIGWTPCIGPTLAAVETLAFESASANRGAILSLGYCIGLGAPFILFAIFLERAKVIRTWLLVRGELISRIGGISLIVIGIFQVTGIWNLLMNSLRSVISGFIPVI